MYLYMVVLNYIYDHCVQKVSLLQLENCSHVFDFLNVEKCSNSFHLSIESVCPVYNVFLYTIRINLFSHSDNSRIFNANQAPYNIF